MSELNDVMEFDHVVRVHPDGSVTSATDAPYVPSAEHDDVADVLLDGVAHLDAKPWSLMSGHTGQYSYNGPVMHASEYIGGGMEAAILDHPGLYVVIEVSAPCDHADSEPCITPHGCESEPAGWAVAYILDED